MKFGFNKSAFFISQRYLFSKKEHNIINLISGISAVGIMISTAALVVVLSVFNGMSNIIGSWFNNLHSDFEITIANGKSFPVDSFPVDKLLKISEIASVDPVVSDLALATYNDRQEMLCLKGVSEDYFESRKLNKLIIDGDGKLTKNNLSCAILGTGIAGKFQLNLLSYEALKLYYPIRTKKNFANAAESFNTRYLLPAGVISTNTNYDENYVFCSIDFVRDLMNYQNEVTSYEINLKNPEKSKQCRNQIRQIIGEKYIIKDKFEQEESLYRTMKSEKLIIFMILALILVLASFNIVGASGMLIIEKQHDISVLFGLGASRDFIRKIFVYEGMSVSAVGGFIGIILGTIVCFIQQTFHVVKLGGTNGNYIIPYYPVDIQLVDIILVFVAILLISFITTIVPAYQLKKSNLLRSSAL